MDAQDACTLSERLGVLCRARGLMLGTAESCTAGGIAAAITDVPGSSAWFDGGFVTYSNAAKERMLGVRGQTLSTHGAVSAEVVAEMAAGLLARLPVDWGVAVSGIAGPEGGSPDKPVGLVWFAWMARNAPARVQARVFPGDRAAVRQATVRHAIAGLLECIGGP